MYINVFVFLLSFMPEKVWDLGGERNNLIFMALLVKKNSVFVSCDDLEIYLDT